jgi:cAMP-specific phosphodiesterase 4
MAGAGAAEEEEEEEEEEDSLSFVDANSTFAESDAEVEEEEARPEAVPLLADIQRSPTSKRPSLADKRPAALTLRPTNGLEVRPAEQAADRSSLQEAADKAKARRRSSLPESGAADKARIVRWEQELDSVAQGRSRNFDVVGGAKANERRRPSHQLDDICRRLLEGTDRAQKSSVERLLVHARGRLTAARDVVADEKATLAQPRIATLVEYLEQAEKSLREVELKLGAEQQTWHSASSSQPSSGMAGRGSRRASFGSFGETSPRSLDEHTQKWLVETFTDQDIEAADVHGSMNQLSPTHSAKRRAKEVVRTRSKSDISQHLNDPDVQELLLKVGAFDFDAYAFAQMVGEQPISVLAAFIFQETSSIRGLREEGWLSDGEAFKKSLMNFFGKIDRMYNRQIPYHGRAHACDVMGTSEWLLRSMYISERTTLLDHFVSIVASAVHDVGHPGRTNAFQMATMAPLALRYNDKSILENMHVASAFEIMQDDADCNWFQFFLKENREAEGSHNVQQYVRKGLIESVLATDMAKHSKHVSDLIEFVEEETHEDDDEDSAPPWQSHGKQKALDMKLFVLASVLHAADISNPCKPHKIMLNWTEKVLAEFWNQGDEELRLGLEVSPLCDRQAGMKAVPKGQIGFINFVVQPFYAPMVRIIPEAQEALDALEENKAFWQKQDEQGAAFFDIYPHCRPVDPDAAPKGKPGSAVGLAFAPRSRVASLEPVSDDSDG